MAVVKKRPVRPAVAKVRAAKRFRTAETAVAVQVSHVTRADRYPVLFDVVRRVASVDKRRRPRILSYGSSTGEEANTLATKYFPGSTVLGLDVLDDVLEQAREKFGANPRLQFEKSGEYAPEPESFDVIFAMSVLCRWPETREVDDVTEWLPFATFDRQVEYLDGLLKPGGILVIYNASYSFLHTRTSRHYDMIVYPRATAGMVRRFRRDGKHDPAVSGTDCVYRKQPEEEWLGERGLVIRDVALTKLAVIERDIAIG